MNDEKREVIPASTASETTIDVVAAISSAVPWIGGPVGNVLTGVSFGRKLGRVREVLDGLANDLNDFKSDVSENYVKTNEFEDLLEQTLRRAAEERNEEKRRLYRAFLAGAIVSPGEPYDDQLQILRTFEQLIPEHLLVIKAISQVPIVDDRKMLGSPRGTLRDRLPDLTDQRIEELVTQLNNMRITKLTTLRVNMTGRGAADLRHNITNYGRRILQYIFDG